MSAEPITPRTVKVRRTGYVDRPVIAVAWEDDTVLTGTGEVHPIDALPGIIATAPPSIVVASNFARLLKSLDDTFKDDPRWQFRIAPDRRDIWKPNAQEFVQRVEGTIVHFFGFRTEDKKPNIYHYPLDPTMWGHRTVHELIPGDTPRVVKLMQWARDVLAWCEEQDLKVTPTSGGIAGQLLRDRRFFPEARRKIPKATNARVRPSLPGNYYRLYVPEGETFSAYYLDMSAAHHDIARSITFPDPDTLYARGRFRVPDVSDVTDSDRLPWARIGTRMYNTVMGGHGLLWCQLSIPHIPPSRFPLPCVEKPGTRHAFVFTNELPTLRALGVVVDFITAAWVSLDAAPGLNRYARFALGQLDEADDLRRRWLKATLLAPYGVLAAKPRPHEFAFRQAKGGTPKAYPAGSGMLDALAYVTSREIEPGTVNVLYRALIEAEQRVRALALARSLHAQGGHVLAVYADSVFVDSGSPLPLLPPPWRVEAELDRLQFFNATSFTSAQVTKLPGIPKDGLERLRRLEEIRRANGVRPA